MGIPELTSFLKTSFNNWHPVNWKDWKHLIIDGNNVCYALYKANCTCLLGGEFMEFVRVIENFFNRKEFKELKKIVIFDGVRLKLDDPDSKVETQRLRKIQFWEQMHRMQCQSEYDPYSDFNCPPLYITSVFMTVIKKLSIDYQVAAEGEADREIAYLANYHKCPVLASDSDFFIFNLRHGFIHFDRYYDQEQNAFFHIDEFQKQYSLASYEMCLLIPLFFGNDFYEYFVSEKRNYGHFLQTIANYQTCEEYISSSDKPAHITCDRLQRVRDQYDCSLKIPISPLSDSALVRLPEWVKECFKVGRFPPQLISMHVKGSLMLPRVYEVVEQESAWKISRKIRQYLYAFMGKSSTDRVTEVIRKNFSPTLCEEEVEPLFLRPPVSIEIIESMEEEEKADLVLTVLQGHKISEDDIKQIFKPLSNEWKLPILATFYWFRNCKLKLQSVERRRDLAKSLLLTFLTCSDTNSIRNNTKRLSQVREDTKFSHFEAIHAFAQWLCVYCDVIALNRLAIEPFPTTSPAYLYSGEVAMYYALASQHKQHWVDNFLHKGSPQYALFDQFLYLVTGTGEDGRAGKHAPKPKGSSYEQPSSQHQARSRATPTQTQSDLQLSNRFATLPAK